MKTAAQALLREVQGRFGTILADPPWHMRDQGTRLAPGYAGSQRATSCYESMPLHAICELGERIDPHLADAQRNLAQGLTKSSGCAK